MEWAAIARLKTGKGRIIGGYIAIGFGLIYLISALTGNIETAEGSANQSGSVTTGLIIFLGGGALLLVSGYRAKKRSERYKKYIMAVYNKKQTDIDSIARDEKESPQMVIETLKIMVGSGFFPGCYVDENLRKLILPKPSEPAAVSKVIKCPGCGASNTVIVGKVGECEYCGSPLG